MNTHHAELDSYWHTNTVLGDGMIEGERDRLSLIFSTERSIDEASQYITNGASSF